MNKAALRSRSLQEVSERAAAGEDFSLALRNFLDHYYGLDDTTDRAAALAAEPAPLGELYDAWLGAVAEHLSWLDRRTPPPWSNDPARFLKRAYFAGGLESLKATLLVESPAAFRRRQIFVTANALRRASALKPSPPASR